MTHSDHVLLAGIALGAPLGVIAALVFTAIVRWTSRSPTPDGSER